MPQSLRFALPAGFEDLHQQSPVVFDFAEQIVGSIDRVVRRLKRRPAKRSGYLERTFAVPRSEFRFGLPTVLSSTDDFRKPQQSLGGNVLSEVVGRGQVLLEHRLRHCRFPAPAGGLVEIDAEVGEFQAPMLVA